MDNPFKNGYIIFHFPGENTLRLFLRELYVVEGKVGVCVIDESMEQLPTGIVQEFGRKVHFIRGSSLDKITYERAKIEKNKAVIYFYTGYALYKKEYYLKAIDRFKSALELENDKKIKSNIAIYIGNCYAHLNEVNTAIFYYNEAKKFYEGNLYSDINIKTLIKGE